MSDLERRAAGRASVGGRAFSQWAKSFHPPEGGETKMLFQNRALGSIPGILKRSRAARLFLGGEVAHGPTITCSAAKLQPQFFDLYWRLISAVTHRVGLRFRPEARG